MEPPPQKRLWPLEVVFESSDEYGPTDLQFQSVEFLLEHQQQLLDAVGKAVKRYAAKTGVPQEMEALLGPAYPELETMLKSGTGWLSLISFQELRVTETRRKGNIVIGCRCRCGWPFDFYRNTNQPDAELGILLAEQGVLRVGPKDLIYEV